MTLATTQTGLRGLEALALAQGGYYDRADALDHGIGDRLLHYHVLTGRFARILPGVYRLSVAPMAQRDDLLLAWVWSNYRGAISHESALELYGLSDVMPSRVQLTVPTTFGRRSDRFDLHKSDLRAEDAAMYEGVCATRPARSIVDAASAGTAPEHIMRAVEEAVQRGLASPTQLRTAANRPRYRYRRVILPLIERALDHAQA